MRRAGTLTILILTIVAAKIILDAFRIGWIIILPLLSLWWATHHHPFPRNLWQPLVQTIALGLWAPSSFLLMIVALAGAWGALYGLQHYATSFHNRKALMLPPALSAVVWHLVIIVISLPFESSVPSLALPKATTIITTVMASSFGSVALFMALCELGRLRRGMSWQHYHMGLYERTHRLV